jgi:predicted nucleic acid-binding protein
MTGTLALIDTNVLVYAFNTDSGDKHAVATGLLAQCWRGEAQFAVSTQNLAEFSAIVREKVTHPSTGDEVLEFLQGIIDFRGWTVLIYGADTVIHAHKMKDEYGLHFWDALLAATMKQHGLGTIYTEDSHFKKIPWMTVVNPFTDR